MTNERLSEHFLFREFYDPADYADVLRGKKAPEASPSDIDPRIIELLEKLRERFTEKWGAIQILIRPHGGYRPDPLNALVGGAAASQHRVGNAADFSVQKANGEKIDAPALAVWTEKWMAEMNIRGGIGMYHAGDHYIHVDARGRNVHWYDSYSSAGCPGQGGTYCLYKQGTKGAGVVLIQRYLDKWGYCPGEADGKCGAKTIAAIKRYQTAHKLKADGLWGKESNKAAGGVLPW